MSKRQDILRFLKQPLISCRTIIVFYIDSFVPLTSPHVFNHIGRCEPKVGRNLH